MISAEASGLPSAPLRMPGPSLIRLVSSRPRPEFSSVAEPPRMTRALSLLPVAARVALKPSLIASSAVNTATTPARPMMMTSDGPQRSGMLLRLTPVMAKICDSIGILS